MKFCACELHSLLSMTRGEVKCPGCGAWFCEACFKSCHRCDPPTIDEKEVRRRERPPVPA